MFILSAFCKKMKRFLCYPFYRSVVMLSCVCWIGLEIWKVIYKNSKQVCE